jgi:hypothetical protein
MKKVIFGLLIFGFTAQMNSQTIELKEVQLVANYNYIEATNTTTEALPVQKIQGKVSDYKANNQEIDEYGDVAYSISFYNSDGKVLADYNTEGKILRTTEKYKNVRLPLEVLQAIAAKFPNWMILEDTYHVSYESDKGITRKIYKIKLMNNDKVLNVKTNHTGEFI